MPAAKRQPSINLLPSDDLPVTLGGRVLRWLLTTFRFMVIVVELIVIMGFLSRFVLDTQNSDLTDEINQKNALIESYLPFENEFKRTQTQLAILADYGNKNYNSTGILGHIASILSPSVQLTSFANRGGRLEIRLTSASESAVSQFIAKLSQYPDVNNVFVSQVENRGGSSLVSFTVSADVKALIRKEEPVDGSAVES